MSYSRYIPGFISYPLSYVTGFATGVINRFTKKPEVADTQAEKELQPVNHNIISEIRAKLLSYQEELRTLEDEFDNFSHTIHIKNAVIVKLPNVDKEKKPPQTEFLAITPIAKIIAKAEKDINDDIDKLQKLFQEAKQDDQYLEMCKLGMTISVRLQFAIDQILEKLSKQHNFYETLKELAEAKGLGILIHKDSTERADNKLGMKNHVEINETKGLIKTHIRNLKITISFLKERINPILSISDEADVGDETEQNSSPSAAGALDSTKSIVKSLQLTPGKDNSQAEKLTIEEVPEVRVATPSVSEQGASPQKDQTLNNNDKAERNTQTGKQLVI